MREAESTKLSLSWPETHAALINSRELSATLVD